MRTDATLRREQSCRASEIVSEHSYPPDDTAINKTQNNHTKKREKNKRAFTLRCAAERN
jgi:hypothetical protein